jgi:hypothetical protein
LFSIYFEDVDEAQPGRAHFLPCMLEGGSAHDKAVELQSKKKDEKEGAWDKGGGYLRLVL